MASSRQLISSTVLGSTATSITFSSIPATFTNLCIKTSHRTDASTNFSAIFIVLNNEGTTLEGTTWLQGRPGVGTSSSRYSGMGGWDPSTSTNSTNSTSDTFSNNEIYFPNYATATGHQASMFMAMENNATDAFIKTWAYSNSRAAAISNIRIQTQAGNFVAGSSFYLYGLKAS